MKKILIVVFCILLLPVVCSGSLLWDNVTGLSIGVRLWDSRCYCYDCYKVETDCKNIYFTSEFIGGLKTIGVNIAVNKSLAFYRAETYVHTFDFYVGLIWKIKESFFEFKSRPGMDALPQFTGIKFHVGIKFSGYKREVNK